MATTEQPISQRIPEDVYLCVKRMYQRFNDRKYKGHENEILLRTVQTAKDIWNKYQAFEQISPSETNMFLLNYVKMNFEEKDLNKERLGDIIFKLHALVKIFVPDENALGGNKELEMLQKKIDKLQKQKADLEKNLHEERKAKEDLFQRLSMVAADRIKMGNPEIADLSDPNRPMKLAEEFNNLYSNAWSDAFERLQQNMNSGSSHSRSENSFQQSSRKPDSKNEEEEITRMLYKVLKSCYEWSQKVADYQKGAIIKAGMGNIDFDNNQMRSNESNKDFPPMMTSPSQGKAQRQQEKIAWDAKRPSPLDSQRSTNGIQGSILPMTSPPQEQMQGELAQEMECSVLDYPAKEFMRCSGVESAKILPEKICQKVMEDRKYQDIEAYVQKCAQLCWLMRIQLPPIELLFDIEPDGKFDHTYYKPYTTSGEKIAYPVWPAMLLHKDGPILSLGVVQCKKR
ncbi:hypothetical protein CHS0354_033468 [Potamilus streckersoni]|uniref:Mitochondria-eating protein C-terminal domain-containing protein n=1 Tax=Potamilus streckersoni TaxID=2493646 RepID=A0AAE0RUV7_9BIVA|nr:hypothetical protein CHS0354_033468 [Potamilus streckersoni]